MHPADVADYVAASVDALRTRLADSGVVEAGEPQLEQATLLRISFEKTDYALVSQHVPSALLGPQGAPAVAVYQAPDLGAPLIRRKLILSMNLADFDGHPPTAELLQADGSPLPADQWPKSLGNQGIINGHPNYARPFFCRRGLREYHTHPQHEDDPWDKYREALSLEEIVLELLYDLRFRWIG